MPRHTIIEEVRRESDYFWDYSISIEELAKELCLYKDYFNNKIIYLNYEDPIFSNMWRYFYSHFELFGLKKLIATSYNNYDTLFKYEYNGGCDYTDYISNECMEHVTKTQLTGNGDFRSKECIEIFKESDIIISGGVPLSLFNEYFDQLIEYEKKFIIISFLNIVARNKVFQYIKDNKIHVGHNRIKDIYAETSNGRRSGFNSIWLTNLECSELYKLDDYESEYSEEKYFKYDNYDAINVDKVKDIPYNYDGIMGVPVLFLYKYNPERFEIIDILREPIINGQRKFIRLLIKWKPEAM